MASRDTIYALSSGATPSGVAVIRISGPGVPGMSGTILPTLPHPRQAVLNWIRDRNNRPIDQALVLYFPGPHSFTGEDTVEIQAHGGRAVVSKILESLKELGYRHAEPGEFSRRAFENGKLDLVQAEALADLVAAETEMQRRLALEQTRGVLSAQFTNWMTELTRARALIEAELDFPDEEDVPAALGESIRATVVKIAGSMAEHLAGRSAAEIVRDGYVVAIAGRPNAGKSSLLNFLAGRSVAIVTDIPGTTRDILTVDLDIDGYLIKFVDMAGVRDTNDVVELEGVARAQGAIASANLVLLLKDALDPMPDLAVVTRAPVISVLTKMDLVPAAAGGSAMAISTVTGSGIDSLLKQITRGAVEQTAGVGGLSIARQRQADYLASAHTALLDYLKQPAAPEIGAELLRRASHLLGKITGQVDVEDLLGVIFSEFCIGK